MELVPDIQLQEKLRRWSLYMAIAVMVVGFLALLGWQFNISFLRQPVPGLVSMNPLTALCFVLSGASFIMLASALSKKAKKRTGAVLALLVGLLASVKMIDLILGLDWQIDRLFYPSRVDADDVAGKMNRMAPNTAFGFLLSALCLFWLYRDGRREKVIMQNVAILIGLIGWFSILGYIYQVKSFYGVFSFIPMAVHTAVCFVLMALSFFFSHPARGFMKEFTSVFSGSLAARLMIPAAILIPTLLGLLRLYGYWSGIYHTELGVVLYTLAFIAVFLGLASYITSTLNRRDVQNKRIEDSIRAREQEISAIFEAAPDAVIVVDDLSRIVKWNKEAETLFGWSSNEIIGRRLTETIIPPAYRDRHLKGVERFLLTGESKMIGTTIELRAVNRQNQEFDLSLRISPVTIKEERLFIGFARDITEQKANARMLSNFNEELKRLVEQKTNELGEILERLSDGFIAVDKEFRYTYMNRKIGEMIGRDPSSMIGKNVWEEFPDAVGSETYHAFCSAMENQQYIANTDYFEPLDLWQENHIYPSQNGLSVFIRDITKRKRAEREVIESRKLADKLIDSLPGVFYFYDNQGKFIRWNTEFEKVTGYSAEEIAVMHPSEFFDRDERDYVSERIQGVFEKGENDAEANFMTRSGNKIPYYFKAVLIDYEKKPCLLGYGVDITSRRKSEEKLRRLTEELRVLAGYLQNVREDERTHIAREIHDELGQQLTVLKMDVAWLNKKINGADDPVKNKIGDLLAMIDTTVKTVRRISSELRPSLLDDLGLVPAIEWHLMEFEKRSGVKTEFTVRHNDKPLPDNIKIGLFRILQESLTNVARHAKATAVKVSFEQHEKEVILSIKDNGIGFDDRNASKKTLGIMGMKERTLMLGGIYTISGESGNGTTVLVSVPLAVSEN